MCPAKKKLRSLPGWSEQLSVTNWMEMGFLTTGNKSSSWLRWKGCQVCNGQTSFLSSCTALKRWIAPGCLALLRGIHLGDAPVSHSVLHSQIPSLTLQQMWALSLGLISSEGGRWEGGKKACTLAYSMFFFKEQENMGIFLALDLSYQLPMKLYISKFFDSFPNSLKGLWWDSVPHRLLDWGPEFLTGYWLESSFSSWPCHPLYRAADNVVSGFQQWASERGRAGSKTGSHSLICNLILKVPSPHFCCILCIRSYVVRSPYVQLTIKERGLHKGGHPAGCGPLTGVIVFLMLNFF